MARKRLKLNVEKHLRNARKKRQHGLEGTVEKLQMKCETLECQNKLHKAKLAVHEDREKRRLEGIQKAAKKRKKGVKNAKKQ